MKTSRKRSGTKVLNATRRRAYRNISAGVKDGQDTAKRLCPVDKGDLVSTITVEDDQAGHASLGTGGKSNVSDRYVNHHVFIEYGTSRMAAQPNYRPGVDAAKMSIRRRNRSNRG